MKDQADRLSDRVEQKALSDCSDQYAQALKRCVRRFAPVFEQLRQLETRTPPSTCKTPSQQDEWREQQRRSIILKSGMAAAIARETAAAGVASADIIRLAMTDIDRINRVVDDIG